MQCVFYLEASLTKNAKQIKYDIINNIKRYINNKNQHINNNNNNDNYELSFYERIGALRDRMIKKSERQEKRRREKKKKK